MIQQQQQLEVPRGGLGAGVIALEASEARKGGLRPPLPLQWRRLRARLRPLQRRKRRMVWVEPPGVPVPPPLPHRRPLLGGLGGADLRGAGAQRPGGAVLDQLGHGGLGVPRLAVLLEPLIEGGRDLPRLAEERLRQHLFGGRNLRQLRLFQKLVGHVLRSDVLVLVKRVIPYSLIDGSPGLLFSLFERLLLGCMKLRVGASCRAFLCALRLNVNTCS
mmetsp:Transcript_9665/g.20053  ORF Transcript_9665/g.20053 Transcript_9665/m.20053 type:complete len:218 (+) Transcript_9665:1848-2501(+)